jgi:hypothetical protein
MSGQKAERVYSAPEKGEELNWCTSRSHSTK